MDKKVKPSMSFKGKFPSIYKSFLISGSGVISAVLILTFLKNILPEQDFSSLEAMLVTAISAWLIATTKTFIEEK